MARPDMRRTVILLPNGFTLANLFFGVFAIVAASRGQYEMAGRYVLFGGIADALDGRVARATRTGTRFGSELDSLVDAISFGLAPAMIMYFAVLNRGGWEWIFCFLFVACACIRLARFNVEQAGRAKTHFHGLPSPAAGMTLATYYWFSQTPLYTETMIGELPWHQMLRFLMLGLSALMISNVAYPAVPTVGLGSVKQVLGTLVVIATIIGVIWLPKEFFFPALMLYVLWGIANTVLLGLLDRRATGDVQLLPVDDDDDERRERPDRGDPHMAAVAGDAAADEDEDDNAPPRRRRRRRHPRGDRPRERGADQPGPSQNPNDEESSG